MVNQAAIDVVLGERLHERRIMQRLTLRQLGAKVGLSYQQIQKYEKGHDRIAASLLVRFASNLNTDIAWFFEGLQKGDRPVQPRLPRGLLRVNAYVMSLPLKQRDAMIAFLQSITRSAF